VVFINSAGLAGTTLLCLILGSVKNAFACGEVAYLVDPRPQFADLDRAWRDFRQAYASKAFWERIKRAGEENLFPAIHEKTGAKLIADSSCDQGSRQWQNFVVPQHNYLARLDNFSSLDILIWKSPSEQAWSYYKRGQDVLGRFRRWLAFHMDFLATSCDPLIIRYRDLAQHPQEMLEVLLERIGNPYDPMILEFWKKRHQCIWGNKSIIRELHQAWETGIHTGIQYRAGDNKLPSAIKRLIATQKDILRQAEQLDQLSLNPEGPND